MSEHISQLYFDYQALNGHRDGCTRGPDTWEVARRIEHNPFPKGSEDEIRRTSLRLYCPECGAVQFFRTPGHLEREFASSAELGFGSEPERVSGLWLWAGPELLPGAGWGPDAYYVTTHKFRPRRASQVAGVIGQGRASARANAAVRWFAGLGCNDYGGCMQAGPEDGFKTRGGAAKWIAAQLETRRGD